MNNGDADCTDCGTPTNAADSGVANLLGQRADRKCINGHWFDIHGRRFFPGQPLVQEF